MLIKGIFLNYCQHEIRIMLSVCQDSCFLSPPDQQESRRRSEAHHQPRKMSELDQLRQEAEQLKNQIRVSPSFSSRLSDFNFLLLYRLTYFQLRFVLQILFQTRVIENFDPSE